MKPFVAVVSRSFISVQLICSCHIFMALPLHATPAGDLLATVGTGVNHILTTIHAEGNQTTSQLTSATQYDKHQTRIILQQLPT